MNPNNKPSAEDRLEAALNRDIRRTSASFERRFSAMRRRLESSGANLAQTNPNASTKLVRFNGLIRISTAIAASLALILGLWQFNSERRDISPEGYDILEGSLILHNEDLIHLNQTLQPTLELFDEELLEFLIAMSDETPF